MNSAPATRSRRRAPVCHCRFRRSSPSGMASSSATSCASPACLQGRRTWGGRSRSSTASRASTTATCCWPPPQTWPRACSPHPVLPPPRSSCRNRARYLGDHGRHRPRHRRRRNGGPAPAPSAGRVRERHPKLQPDRAGRHHHRIPHRRQHHPAGHRGPPGGDGDHRRDRGQTRRTVRRDARRGRRGGSPGGICWGSRVVSYSGRIS